MTDKDNSPLNKDALLDLDMNDPTTVLKLQEHYRELNRRWEHEKNQRIMLENKLKLLSSERAEDQRRMESLNLEKVALEQLKVDLQAKMRAMQYNIGEEEEKRRNSELLLEKTKDQLIRKDDKYASSLEDKERDEMERRNVKMELRVAKSRILELENLQDELSNQLSHERGSRRMTEEKGRMMGQYQSEKPVAAEPKGYETEAGTECGELSDILRAEIYDLQTELERQKTRAKDENALILAENDDLEEATDALKNHIRMGEDALTQTTLYYGSQIGKLKTENMNLSIELETEKTQKAQLEAELESIKTRLQNTMAQMEEATNARNQLEITLQQIKEEHRQEMFKKMEALEKVREINQELMDKQKTIDQKLITLETELNVCNTSLVERTNQLKQMTQDLDCLKKHQETLDLSLKQEKEHNSKLNVKVDDLQAQVTKAHHDALTMKQEMEEARRVAVANATEHEREKSNAALMNLKTEHHQATATLQSDRDKIAESCAKLKADASHADEAKASLKEELRALHTENAEMVKKVTQSDATAQVAEQMKRQMEDERSKLKNDHDKLQEKFQTERDSLRKAESHVNELQHKVQTGTTAQTKEELQEVVKKLQEENAELVSKLNHERQRIETLSEEIRASQNVRGGLENLCSNLKSTNTHLEDKLQPMNDELSEKVKLHTVIGGKKDVENKLEAEQHRSGKLEKEVVTLRVHLKNAKQKLREAGYSVNITHEGGLDCDKMAFAIGPYSNRNQSGGHSNHNGHPENYKVDLEAKYRQELNRKLDDVNRYLEDQAHARDKMSSSHGEKEAHSATKTRKLEEQNLDLKMKYEKAVAQCQTKDMEVKHFKELYDSEMKWRMRLSDQLQHAQTLPGDEMLA